MSACSPTARDQPHQFSCPCPKRSRPANAPYPWLRGICWIGTNGQQLIKWTVRDQITPVITVGWHLISDHR